MSDDVLINVENLSKKFCRNLKRSLWYGVQDITNELSGRERSHNMLRKGEFWALDDISFEVRRGECLGLIGHNGAGKTTLLRILNGLIKPDKGKITMRGQVGALIALGAGFNPILTGRENVYATGAILGLPKKQLDNKYEEIVEFSELQEFMDTPVQNYSSGMQVRLGFAVAAQMDPDILIIDEVLAIGDASFRAKCYHRLGQLIEKSAVIVVSHSMIEISRLCTNAMLLVNGKTEYQGDNVSVGINSYFSLIKTLKSTEIHTVEARILNTKIMNAHYENECAIIKDKMSLEVTAYISDSIKYSPIVQIAFVDLSMQNVCQISSVYSNASFVARQENIKVQATIENIRLRPGIYYIDIGIIDDKGIKVLARNPLAHKVQIVGPYTGYGVTLREAEWHDCNREGLYE